MTSVTTPRDPPSGEAGCLAGVTSLSKSQVSLMAAELDEMVEGAWSLVLVPGEEDRSGSCACFASRSFCLGNGGVDADREFLQDLFARLAGRFAEPVDEMLGGKPGGVEVPVQRGERGGAGRIQDLARHRSLPRPPVGAERDVELYRAVDLRDQPGLLGHRQGPVRRDGEQAHPPRCCLAQHTHAMTVTCRILARASRAAVRRCVHLLARPPRVLPAVMVLLMKLNCGPEGASPVPCVRPGKHAREEAAQNAGTRRAFTPRRLTQAGPSGPLSVCRRRQVPGMKYRSPGAGSATRRASPAAQGVVAVTRSGLPDPEQSQAGSDARYVTAPVSSCSLPGFPVEPHVVLGNAAFAFPDAHCPRCRCRL